MHSPKETAKGNASALLAEEENQDDIESKEWSKTSVMKERDSAQSEPSMLPRLETLIPTMQSPWAFPRQNGASSRKRFRLEEDEYDTLDNLACNFTSELMDDCDAFGRHVAAQLRLMNKMQKFIAQRLISEVCFRGQIQHLQLTTNLAHTPTYQTTQIQPQSQTQVYPTRPSHGFVRPQDYMLLHPQPLRHPIPVTSAGVASTYPNFAQQQTDHPGISLNHLESFNVN